VSDIHVEKMNESHVRIQCDRGILHEINDRYTFFVPNYRFMPKYRNGLWDGKLRLLDTRNQVLPHGLVTDLLKFAKQSNYDITLEESVKPTSVDIEQCKKFLECIDIPFVLRDYQLETFRKIIQNQRHVIVSPTGSGKSLVIYLTALYSQTVLEQKTLIIVPTTSLVEQMTSDFADYSINNGWSTDDYVHKIYSGHEKLSDKPIVITTWQSIFRLGRGWFEPFGTVICDEAHLAKAKSITSVMDKCVNATHRIGTTGTLDNSETHKLVLQGLFGDVFKATTTKKLIDADTLSKTKINLLRLEYSSQDAKDFRREVSSYPDEMAYLVSNDRRNEFICRLAIAQKKNTLILYNYVDTHGIPLFEKLKQLLGDSGRTTFFISGAIDTASREYIRKIMETESNAILVASMGTFSTGVNIKNLHNIILASPTKSVIRVLQSIGRGLRKHGENSILRVYDIIDDITDGKSKKNFALKHGLERMKLYMREKFDHAMFSFKL